MLAPIPSAALRRARHPVSRHSAACAVAWPSRSYRPGTRRPASFSGRGSGGSRSERSSWSADYGAAWLSRPCSPVDNSMGRSRRPARRGRRASARGARSAGHDGRHEGSFPQPSNYSQGRARQPEYGEWSVSDQILWIGMKRTGQEVPLKCQHDVFHADQT
jgi:hypothetical protein